MGRAFTRAYLGRREPMPGSERAGEPDVVHRLDEVTEALADLGEALSREEELGRVLQRSVNQVVQAIPGADMASVSVLLDSSPYAETVASSSDQVWNIDADQYDAGEGPCLEAARTGVMIRVDVEQARERWPRFARGAHAAGVASYLSAPLSIDDEFAGSLNLYSEQRGGFSDLEEALLRMYTTAATAAIANARRYAQARSAHDNLRRALNSRAVIDQAIGMLMLQRGISAQQAFDELVRQSQNTNTKLREVAARVVEQVHGMAR